MALGGEGKARGEKNQHLAAWDGAQIFGQSSNREEHGACAIIGLDVRKAGDAGNIHGRGTSGGSSRAAGIRIGSNVRGLYALGGGLKKFSVGGEVLDDAEGAGEFNDGHQVVWRSVGVNELCGRGTGGNLVGQGHRGVVKEKNEIVFLRVLRSGGVRPRGETDHGLLFVIFKNAKIIFRQIVKILAFFVGNDGVDEDQARLFCDGGADLHGLLFCSSLRSWSWSRRILGEARQRDKRRSKSNRES